MANHDLESATSWFEKLQVGIAGENPALMKWMEMFGADFVHASLISHCHEKKHVAAAHFEFRNGGIKGELVARLTPRSRVLLMVQQPNPVVRQCGLSWMAKSLDMYTKYQVTQVFCTTDGIVRSRRIHRRNQ